MSGKEDNQGQRNNDSGNQNGYRQKNIPSGFLFRLPGDLLRYLRLSVAAKSRCPARCLEIGDFQTVEFTEEILTVLHRNFLHSFGNVKQLGIEFFKFMQFGLRMKQFRTDGGNIVLEASRKFVVFALRRS